MENLSHSASLRAASVVLPHSGTEPHPLDTPDYVMTRDAVVAKLKIKERRTGPPALFCIGGYDTRSRHDVDIAFDSRAAFFEPVANQSFSRFDDLRLGVPRALFHSVICIVPEGGALTPFCVRSIRRVRPLYMPIVGKVIRKEILSHRSGIKNRTASLPDPTNDTHLIPPVAQLNPQQVPLKALKRTTYQEETVYR